MKKLIVIIIAALLTTNAYTQVQIKNKVLTEKQITGKNKATEKQIAATMVDSAKQVAEIKVKKKS